MATQQWKSHDKMGRKSQKVHIGTSGWHYKHWVGPFYPESTKSEAFMAFYEQFFQTVELNNSFYHIPPAKTFEKWARSSPDDFIFSVKANRHITHLKKLKSSDTLSYFMQQANALKEKLGPILFQLPPNWKYNEERFQSFLKELPEGYRFTFEFRDPSWYNEDVYELLKGYNIAFCIYELGYHRSPAPVTADFVYVRLHGPEEKYQGDYDEATLQLWAARCDEWRKENLDVFIYFDNDQYGYAAKNAIKLMELIGTKLH